jgi:hypothetical protein
MLYGVRHAFTKESLFVAVPKFDGLVLARGRATRHGGAPHEPTRQANFRFDCWIAA